MNLIEKWKPHILKLTQLTDVWDTLVINKRKPYTYRAFTYLPDGNRVCLHKFEPCDESESFKHPHAWPAEFLVCYGSYLEEIELYEEYISEISGNLIKTGNPVVSSVYTQNSWHRIDNRDVFHKVTPLETTYTIMINEKPYMYPHPDVKTTKGKDLDSMTFLELKKHLEVFKRYLEYLPKDGK